MKVKTVVRVMAVPRIEGSTAVIETSELMRRERVPFATHSAVMRKPTPVINCHRDNFIRLRMSSCA